MKAKKKLEIVLKQGDLVGMMIDRIKEHGKSNSGSYNRVDPTHFEKGEARFELMQGYTVEEHNKVFEECEICKKELAEIPEENADQRYEVNMAHQASLGMPYPNPEVVTARFHDCTWGVSFEFETSMGKVSAYWNRDFAGSPGEWSSVHPKFEQVFKDMLFADPEGTNEATALADEMGFHYE